MVKIIKKKIENKKGILDENSPEYKALFLQEFVNINKRLKSEKVNGKHVFNERVIYTQEDLDRLAEVNRKAKSRTIRIRK